MSLIHPRSCPHGPLIFSLVYLAHFGNATCFEPSKSGHHHQTRRYIASIVRLHMPDSTILHAIRFILFWSGAARRQRNTLCPSHRRMHALVLRSASQTEYLSTNAIALRANSNTIPSPL